MFVIQLTQGLQKHGRPERTCILFTRVDFDWAAYHD